MTHGTPVRPPGLMRPRARGRERQAGYALFLVLSLILLLSLLLTGVTRDSRGQARAALRTLQAAEARAGAETALSLAVMRLLAARPEDRWHADGTARRLTLDGQEWRVTLTPEDAKVDINHAPTPLLAELFAAAGAAPGEAQALADRVADWRDADDLTHVNGAERRAYEDAGLPPPRNGPFLKPEEIRRVMGMTEGLYSCIADAITVYSGKAGIDRRYAPELLKVKESAVPEGPPPRSENAAAAPARPPTVSPLTFESVAGKAVTVRLVPEEGTAVIRSQEQVLRITEDLRRPYWILSRPQPLDASKGKGSKCVDSPQQIAADEQNDQSPD